MTREINDEHQLHRASSHNGTKSTLEVNGDSAQPLHVSPLVNDSATPETLDVVIIGAGFAGVYLLYQLRRRGFAVKAVEVGSDLGGVWHSNRYPGARVDTQYPVYCYSLPEVWEDWTWTCEYPDQAELQRYFQHVDAKLGISKDVYFGTRATAARFNDSTDTWTISSDTGRTFQSRYFIASTGFAAKRYIPEYSGLDSFKGIMHHSSFWPSAPVNVKGLRVGVLGSGATGIQITQEWADEVGETGSVKMFQRTPNLCCPMKQRALTLDQQATHKTEYPEWFNRRYKTFGGFLYGPRSSASSDHTPEERQALYEELWSMGGFRFYMNNYNDISRDLSANREAYNFWRDKTRARIKDKAKADILAPMEPPHPFGAKRVALEQGLYEKFNRPNVDVVDIKAHQIIGFEPEGIRTADGTLHELDVLAVATGFDSLTGGIKNLGIHGLGGKALVDKWDKGTHTYVGMATSGFPNFFFTYGPQAPSAFSNGAACIELQGDWIVNVLVDMRLKGHQRIDADRDAEMEWKVEINELSAKTLRHYTDSWYNGSNIPGKPKEPLNYSGGLLKYRETLRTVREQNYRGFTLS